MYVLMLMIMFQNEPAVVATAVHEPFVTEQACTDYAAEIEDRTKTLIAKLNEQGHEVADYKTYCQKAPEEN